MNSENPKKKSGGKLLAAIVIGGAIGSVLGLAFAPNKGTQFRKKMKDMSGKALDKIKEKMDEEGK